MINLKLLFLPIKPLLFLSLTVNKRDFRIRTIAAGISLTSLSEMVSMSVLDPDIENHHLGFQVIQSNYLIFNRQIIQWIYHSTMWVEFLELSKKRHEVLSVRLFPIQGKGAGDLGAFENACFRASTMMDKDNMH